MKSISRAFACPKRRSPSDLRTWARAVVADPAGHGATEREAAIVGELLLELEVSR